jgi:hypothetical protein
LQYIKISILVEFIFKYMETLDLKVHNLAYNYEALESFFNEIADPRQTACHLGHLLHFLVYYQREQNNIEDYYHIYSEIFELQQVLLSMTNTGEHGNQ